MQVIAEAVKIYSDSLLLSNEGLSDISEEMINYISANSKCNEINLVGNSLKQLPDTFGKLKITSLILSHNQFQEIPPSVLEISTLTNLSIKLNKMEKIPANIAKLSSLKILSLSENFKLTNHAALGSLKNLEQLDITANNISVIPEEFTSLTNLTSLSLTKNRIKNINNLYNCTNLEKLDIGHNQLMEFPKIVYKFPHLNLLALSFNPIHSIPEDISKCTALKMLSLASTSLKNASHLTSLTTLRQLVLSDNKLTSLSDQFSQLIHLEELHLFANSIHFDFDKTVFCATYSNLLILDLSGQNMYCIPDCIGNLVNVQQLNFANNNIQFIPPSISNCKRLTFLSFTRNQISSLFPHFFEMKSFVNLEHNLLPGNLNTSWRENLRSEGAPEYMKYHSHTVLNLSNCGITEINSKWAVLIEQHQVSSINLSNNKLEYIPVSLLSLKHVELKGNPLSTIPEPFKGNWHKLKSYLLSIQDNSRKWDRCKLMIVGQEGVGKTTLLKSLQSKSGKADTKHNLSTNGIEIVKNLKFKKFNKMLKFDVWDFGGQEVFYPTHQFFLTSKKAVYLIIFNPLHLNDSRIEYWLKTVKLLTTNSPDALIFLVGTHSELLSAESIAHVTSLLKMKFTKQFYRGIQPAIYLVSCATGAGIQALKKDLATAISKDNFLPMIGESWARLYHYITEQITHFSCLMEGTKHHDLRKSQKLNDKKKLSKSKKPLSVPSGLSESADDEKNYVSWEEFETWMEICGVSKSEYSLVIEFLVSVGTITYINDTSKNLNDFVILNPQWLANLMSLIVSFQQTFIQDGYLLESHLPLILKGIEPKLQSAIVEWLVRFKIIFPLPSGNKYVIPSLLPDTIQPDVLNSLWPVAIPSEYIELQRIFEFYFLPTGFFSQLLARILFFEKVENKLYWRNGSISTLNESEELCLIEYSPSIFTVKIASRIKKTTQIPKLLPKVIRVIEETMKVLYGTMDSTNHQQRILCTECLNTYVDEVFQFSRYECIQAVLEGASEVFCKKSAKPVPLLQLVPDYIFTNVPVIPENLLECKHLLGKGGFGQVYSGILSDPNYPKPIEVAIKLLMKSDESKDRIIEMYNEFSQEVGVMVKLTHPNIVKLFGILMKPSLGMVLEFMNKGDLFEYLQSASQDMPWKTRLLIVYDIAKAMEYFEENFFCHRDLRTQNILLYLSEENELRGKLADFGLARQLLGESNEVGHQIFCYNPPETLLEGKYDILSDIYSFSICCWEVATRRIPYSEYENDPRFSIPSADGGTYINLAAIKTAIVNDNLRPSLSVIDPGCPMGFREILCNAWSHDRQQRGTFKAIAEQLSDILNKEFTVKTPEQSRRRAYSVVEVNEAIVEQPMIHVAIEEHSLPKESKYEEKSIILPDCISLLHLIIEKLPLNLHANIVNICSTSVGLWVGLENGEIRVYSNFIAPPSFQWNGSLSAKMKNLFHPTNNSKSIWSCYSDGSIRIWNTSDQILIKELFLDINIRCSASNIVSRFCVCSVSSNEVWFCSNVDNLISVYNCFTFELMHTIPVPISGELNFVNILYECTSNLVFLASSNHLFVIDTLSHLVIASIDFSFKSKEKSISAVSVRKKKILLGFSDGFFLSCSWNEKERSLFVQLAMQFNFPITCLHFFSKSIIALTPNHHLKLSKRHSLLYFLSGNETNLSVRCENNIVYKWHNKY